MQYTEQQLLDWLAHFMWPLLRVGSLFVSLPVLSTASVPPQVRILLAIGVSLVLGPVLPPLPQVALFSLPGLAIAVQEVFIGVLAGFIMQWVYGTVIGGGQNIAYSMGLGFASLLDPQTGVQAPVVSQFYLLLTTFLFLATDGHLLIIRLLADSFHTLPIGEPVITVNGVKALLAWSGLIFSGSILLALPIMVALLVVTFGFGVATRAAPQLNIFSVGFPVTLMLGLVLMWVLAPAFGHQVGALLHQGYDAVAALLRQ